MEVSSFFARDHPGKFCHSQGMRKVVRRIVTFVVWGLNLDEFVHIQHESLQELHTKAHKS